MSHVADQQAAVFVFLGRSATRAPLVVRHAHPFDLIRHLLELHVRRLALLGAHFFTRALHTVLESGSLRRLSKLFADGRALSRPRDLVLLDWSLFLGKADQIRWCRLFLLLFLHAFGLILSCLLFDEFDYVCRLLIVGITALGDDATILLILAELLF